MARPKKVVNLVEGVTEPVTEMEVAGIRAKVNAGLKRKKSKARIFNLNLGNDTSNVIDMIKKETNRSWSDIIGHAIEFTHTNRGFEGMDVFVPKSVAKAKELLAKWESKAQGTTKRAKRK